MRISNPFAAKLKAPRAWSEASLDEDPSYDKQSITFKLDVPAKKDGDIDRQIHIQIGHDEGEKMRRMLTWFLCGYDVREEISPSPTVQTHGDKEIEDVLKLDL